ncbi:Bifunctional polynucleotide phosphatase/kinase [Leucoagaricus sp. SymC.cos]|nr:Bifunctional polynucleotide phosphatase/kinase [Leucoagaricus sp. SymC.cos]
MLEERSAEDSPAGEPTPKKIHPFFTKNAGGTGGKIGSFLWLDLLGKNKTCLHGKNSEPKCYPKVAAFDLDGTIIKSKGRSSSTGSNDWEWWHSTVPVKLQEVAQQGYTIAIISNQAIKPAALKQWKEKVVSMASRVQLTINILNFAKLNPYQLKDVPFWIFAATAKDQYRKPMLGMWWELEKIFEKRNVKIDLQSSFFVGDAAGRQYKNQKSDFSSTDRKLALNIGISFMTPEEYFLKLPVHSNYVLPGFHVSMLQDCRSVNLYFSRTFSYHLVPAVTPTSSPIIPCSRNQEIILFCGYPALGKTRFYTQHFGPANYTHINQDTLKTRDKCIKSAREALLRGESCVIDNTNRDIKTRKFYTNLAKEFQVPIRCFVFTGSIDLAWHNNLYRTFHRPPSRTNKAIRDLVPYSAFISFREQYEAPTMDEGFAEIRQVNWKFGGTDEEKKNWSMWLQIDGK